MAAIQGYTSVVKILLDHGDDVNTKDNRGKFHDIYNMI